MKILHVIQAMDPASGGPPLIAFRLAAAQAGLGHEVHILSYRNAGARQTHQSNDLHLHDVVTGGFIARLLARRSVAELLRNANVVHLHGPLDRLCMLAAATAARIGRPYLVEMPGNSELTPKQKRVLNAAAAVRLSHAAEETQLHAMGLMVPRVIIPNGEADEFATSAAWHVAAANLISAYALAAGAPAQLEAATANRPLRVLHVTSSIDPRSGGPVTALAGLAEAQVKMGLRVSIASTYRANDQRTVLDRMQDAGVNMRVVGPVASSFGWCSGSGQFIREMVAQADIVHIHAVWEDILYKAARTAWKLGIPYIVRPCGMLEPWSLEQKALKKKLYLWLRLRWVLRHAAAMNYTGTLEQQSAAPLQIPSASIVEPIGLDLRDFADLPSRGSFRAQYPKLGDKPVVIFLSRLHPKKGLEFVIPAFLKAGVADAMLVIAGPDSDGYRAQVEEMVTRQGLRDRTIFTGMLYGAQRVAALVDADLFVLPSYQENFGIVVIEALAAGLPVVISKNVNIHPEVVAAGLGSAVSLDVDEIADQIRRWLGDSALRQSVRERAPAHVRARYNWERIALRWAEHYRSLIRSTTRA